MGHKNKSRGVRSCAVGKGNRTMRGMKLAEKSPKREICDHLNGAVGSIRGHFWLELADGTIIDPMFEVYDAIKYMKGLEGEALYRPASEEIQRSMTMKHILPVMKKILVKSGAKEEFKRIQEVIKSREKKDEKDEARNEMSPLDASCYRGGYCHINSTINKYIYGKDSKIVYGDMGWKIKGTDEIFWEYEDAWNGKYDDRLCPYDMIKRLKKNRYYMNMIMADFKY